MKINTGASSMKNIIDTLTIIMHIPFTVNKSFSATYYSKKRENKVKEIKVEIKLKSSI